MSIIIIYFLHQDNSSAMVLHKDGNSDSELDAELNSLRKKLADVSTLLVKNLLVNIIYT